jgi:hypothetical protein
MRRSRSWLTHLCAGSALLLSLAGCAHDAAVQGLSPAEQSEFYTYRYLMTSAQVQTYLAKTTARDRTDYLHTLGLMQRVQAADPPSIR